MKLLCNLFGHKWNYYKLLDGEVTEFRFCKHCTKAQYLTSKYFFCQKGWMTMVQRTIKGAKEALKEYI